MSAARRTATTVVLDLWVLMLAALLCLPALTHRGLGLSGDLVFSPRQPLTLDTVGLGSRLPRAVPLDAVLALLGAVVPGGLLFRVAVLAGLVLAGCAVHRLADDLGVVGRFVAASFAVWNPFVVERLALGQWALLLAYGALAWVVLASVTSRGSRGAPWSTWAWTGLASLTPTGGLLATVTATALAGRRGGRTVLALVGCLALQLPWVLPSLVGGSATGPGDPAGVAAFGAHADAPGGTLVSLLGLGGIWDLDSVPTSRGSALGVLAAFVVVGSLALAWRRLPAGLRPLVPLAAGGLVLACAPVVPGLDAVVRWVVADVPGGGLLRDSQKWLVPFVLLAAVSLGVAVDRLLGWTARHWPGLAAVAAALAVCVPFVLLPDAAGRTWDAVRPVTYPGDFAAVRDRLAASADPGAMVLLPWRAYRRFEWGNARTADDPAYAWFDVPMVGSDDLVVGRRTVSDHDPSAQRVRRAADSSDPAARLAALGVGWALVYTDDPATPDLRLDGLDRVVDGRHVQLYRVPGPVRPQPAVPSWRRVLVVGTDLVVLLGWVAVGLLAGRRRFAATLHSVVRRSTRSEVS